MQTMQDKDFDQLFKNSFEDFEVEPAANTWDKIEQRMGRKPRVRALNYRWMAAASVAVIVAAAFLLNNNTEPMKLSGKPKKQEAVSNGNATGSAQDVVIPDLNGSSALAENQTALPPSTGRTGSSAKTIEPVPVQEPVQQQQAAATLVAQNQQVQPQPQQPVNRPVVAAPETQSGIANAQAENPAEQAPSLVSIVEEKQPEGRRRPFSVGRLVNSIVAKVDNREDKVIEFRDEDDSSVISGINLGFIKLKKSKQ